MTKSQTTKIGVITATIIGMNAMIGSGIFIVPATLASFVGPAGILAFIFVIISVLCMGLSLSKVASLFPQEGSFYAYTKQWAGHTMGLIASGAYLVGLIIAMGLLSQIAGFYIHSLMPQIPAFALGLSVLIALTILNLFGVVLSERGQQILICTTVFPLLATTIMCLTKIDLNNLFPFAPHGFAYVFKATRKIIFGFFGFECAASLFTIVAHPERNVPRALTWAIIIVGIIYTLFVSAIILSTPMQLFTSPNTPLPETLRLIFPHQQWLITIIHLSILSAILGTIHSMIWSASSLLVSLTKKIKNSNFHHLIGRHISERTAVLIIGLGIFITFSTLANIDLFFNLTAIFIVFAYICSMFTLLTIHETWKTNYVIITIIGIGTALTILSFAIEGLFMQLIAS